MIPHQIIQFYFECLQDLGEQMSFDLIKKKKSGTEILTYNHLIYDGVSALTEHLAAKPYKAPELIYKGPPSVLMRLLLINRWWYSVAYRKFFRPKGEGQGEFLFETRVLTLANENNLNARILKGLHQALNTKKTTLWMLPVSLHERIYPGMPPQNNVSFLDVKVKTTDSALDVKSKINRELKLQSYWSTIYSMVLPQIIGKKLFNKSFKYFDFFLHRTGTFTNLGKWEIPDLEENESWGIKATVVPLNPLGASALQINNQLTIGLQVHPNLKLEQADLHEILDRWQKSIQNQ